MSNRTKRRAAQRHANKLAHSSDTPAAKPTTSESQIAANRENSTHSTGPTSTAGKAASSQNRTTHGLNYNPSTFRVLACENQSEYDNLLQTLQQEQSPAGAVENLLVVSMAQHRWLLDRATRLQETCFDQQTGQVTDQKLFALYLRYATTHERAFHRCLNDLLKLRNQTIKQQIGFESEKRRADRHTSFLKLEEIEFLLREQKLQTAQWQFESAKRAEEKQEKVQKAA